MKTNTSDQRTAKAILINAFAQSLDSNCANSDDVVKIISSVGKMNSFFIDQQQKPLSLILELLAIKEMASENCGEDQLRAQEDAVDLVVTTKIQAECLKEGGNLLYEVINDEKLVRLLP
jgi:hemoglobin-like flavoprotein